MKFGPKIVTDGLVLALDAANPNSYPGSGTTWNDLTPNKNNGTLVNGPTFDSANGGSIVFDGINDYCSLPNLALNYPFHISFWGEGTSTSDATGIAFVNPTSNAKSISLQIVPDINAIRITYYDGSFTSASTFGENNTIYKVSGNFTSTGFDLYVNGVFANSLSGNKSKIWTDTNTSYNISLLNRPNTIYFPGNIYTTEIYNRTLTPEEILQNYNALKDRFI